MDYMITDRKNLVPDITDDLPHTVYQSAARYVTRRLGHDPAWLRDVLEPLGLTERLES